MEHGESDPDSNEAASDANAEETVSEEDTLP